MFKVISNAQPKKREIRSNNRKSFITKIFTNTFNSTDRPTDFLLKNHLDRMSLDNYSKGSVCVFYSFHVVLIQWKLHGTANTKSESISNAHSLNKFKTIVIHSTTNDGIFLL